MIEIIKLENSTIDKPEVLQQVKDIFFLSTSIKEFSTPERREAFYKKWCGDYVEIYPHSFFVMKEGQKVLGYLSGCINSREACKALQVPGFELFADQFDFFPAHLHINFHPDCRGRGLGSLLVEHFCQELKRLQIKGVHLITSRSAANVSFYRRLDFKVEIERDYNQRPLLFMGKILDH